MEVGSEQKSLHMKNSRNFETQLQDWSSTWAWNHSKYQIKVKEEVKEVKEKDNYQKSAAMKEKAWLVLVPDLSLSNPIESP